MNAKKGSGILGGLAIFVIGIGLLWYNEGNNVKNIESVNEGLKNYTDIKSDTIDNTYDGKLVATSGKLEVTGEIIDTEFNVKSNSAVLNRKVEMYQWSESCDEEDICTYEKKWDDMIIDSSNFRQSGHSNPESMPYESQSVYSDNAKIGAFTLPESLLEQLSTKHKITNLSEEVATSHAMTISNNYYTNVIDNTPEIGNVRISFYENDDKVVSVLATQSNDSFKTYTAKNGKKIFRIFSDEYNGKDMFSMITKQNNMLKWILRIVGTLMIIGGINGLFEPLVKLTNKVPILGNIVGGATGLVSFVIGLAISLLIIAIAWFRFRPIISILLIALAVGGFFALKMYNNKKPKTTE